MRRLAALAFALALCSCARPAEPGDGDAMRSGIRGRVVLFPSTPVEIGTSPSPVKGVATGVFIESEDGDIRRIATESDGTFSVALPPGTYVVSPQLPPGSTYVPVGRTVTVEEGLISRVTLLLETRLREP
jgi:hypothetical protein